LVGPQSYFGPVSRHPLILLILGALTGGASDFPAPSGSFIFDGRPYIGTTTLTNTSFTNKSLSLNGRYYNADQHKRMPDGYSYHANFRPLTLDYRRFTAIVKLCPADIAHARVLLVGGTAHRWLVLRADESAKLEICFNNHDFLHTAGGSRITNGQWITIAVSVDLESRRVELYVNGSRADELVLPQGFTLNVLNDETWRESDREFMLTDYGDGGNFQGLVAGLLTFDSILSSNQVRQVFPIRRPP